MTTNKQQIKNAYNTYYRNKQKRKEINLTPEQQRIKEALIQRNRDTANRLANKPANDTATTLFQELGIERVA